MNALALADQRAAHMTRDDQQPTAGTRPRIRLAPARLTNGFAAPAVFLTGSVLGCHVPLACLVAAATGAAIAAGAGALPRLYWISLYAKLVRAGVRHAQNVEDVRSLVHSLNDAPVGRQR